MYKDVLKHDVINDVNEVGEQRKVFQPRANIQFKLFDLHHFQQFTGVSV